MNPTDNQQLRALLCLPPIQPGAGTALAVPEMPPQETVTGDQEVDAVLWLQKVVATGNQPMIAKALEAAKRIKTPMKDLAKRYTDHVSRASGGHFGAVLATFGFGDLEDQAKRAIERAALRHEALSRFGNAGALFNELPAERACRLALKRLKRDEFGMYDDAMACDRFEKRPELVPATIDDCLYTIQFWHHLYRLRDSVDEEIRYYENTRQAYAHECYAFFMLGDRQPRNQEEAVAAFEHVQSDDKGQWAETDGILRNLVVSGWESLQNRQQNIHENIPTHPQWIFSRDAQPDAGVEVICLDVDEHDGVFGVSTAARPEGSDWRDAECGFWWMHIPPIPVKRSAPFKNTPRTRP